jgi:hypothetical protein
LAASLVDGPENEFHLFVVSPQRPAAALLAVPGPTALAGPRYYAADAPAASGCLATVLGADAGYAIERAG